MGILLHIITYACLAVFFIAVGVKFYKYQTMPLHLRWELYPVAHEGHKAHYGGSFFEETEWYNKKRTVDRVSEAKHMLPEMIFLSALWHHNKALWFRSFPFHFGMYNMIGFLVLLNVGAVMQIAGMDVGATAGALGAAVHYLTIITGFFGMGLGVIGAMGLLQRRLTDENLKDFTKPSDLFNLVFLGGAFVLLLAAGITNPTFAVFREWVVSVLTLNLAFAPADMLTSAAIALSSLAIAYIPLTHMAHFVVKYFTYHNIRWDDAPNMPGSDFEPRIGEVLNYPVTWAADHINPKGVAMTWAEVATADVTADKEDA
jgi:nitrate reductase gamma subunit